MKYSFPQAFILSVHEAGAFDKNKSTFNAPLGWNVYNYIMTSHYNKDFIFLANQVAPEKITFLSNLWIFANRREIHVFYWKYE